MVSKRTVYREIFSGVIQTRNRRLSWISDRYTGDAGARVSWCLYVSAVADQW